MKLAMARGGEKLYARNGEALNELRASSEAAPATIAMHRHSSGKTRIVTRDSLVKKLGDVFYQPENTGDAKRGAIRIGPDRRMASMRPGQFCPGKPFCGAKYDEA